MGHKVPTLLYVVLRHHKRGPSVAAGVYSSWEAAKCAGDQDWRNRTCGNEMPMEHTQAIGEDAPYYQIESFYLDAELE